MLLDLASASWKAINSDQSVIDDKKLYNTIDRNKLEFFELHTKKKGLLVWLRISSKDYVFRIKTNGKTLIHRLKTQGRGNLAVSLEGNLAVSLEGNLGTSSKLKVTKRIRITALLQKNKDSAKNVKYSNYEFDPNLSEIHYLFEDGTTQIRNDFGDSSPYLPLELIQTELEHLNGV